MNIITAFIWGAIFGFLYPIVEAFIIKLIQETKNAKKEW